MQLSNRSIRVLKTLAPQIESLGMRAKVSIAILIVLILVGLFGLYKQIADGHVVTGMRDHVVWGIYIANFIFFIGISYAGAMLAGILHLFRVSWRGPIMRIATLVTFVAAFIGPIFILLCIGRFDRLHYLFIYARLQSPIIWDVLAISTYLIGAILFVYLTLIRDFAIYRDSPDLKIPTWRKKAYRWLALGYEGTEEQRKQLRTATDLIALILIPMVIVVSSVLSWIFGMTLRPGWHSTIFGPYFVIASAFTGVGVIIVTMWIFRHLYKIDEFLVDKHFRYMGYILLVMAFLYGYFTFSEYLTDWYSAQKWDSEVIDKLLSLNEYGWWFLLSSVLGVVVPIIICAVPRLRTPNLITLAAALVVLAMWVRRYLIVVPTLETPLIPIQDPRPEFVNYSISWVEWSLTIGGVATFLLFFIVISKFVTIISVAEILDKKTTYWVSDKKDA